MASQNPDLEPPLLSPACEGQIIPTADSLVDTTSEDEDARPNRGNRRGRASRQGGKGRGEQQQQQQQRQKQLLLLLGLDVRGKGKVWRAVSVLTGVVTLVVVAVVVATQLYVELSIPLPFSISSSSSSSSSFSSSSPLIAICLVGGARDFELTGPSILQNLLPTFPGADLFVNSPLDENSFKLAALLAAPSIAAFKIFPSTWVDEKKFPNGILQDKSSPQGVQGMLQYFRLVEGCKDLVEQREQAAGGVRYRWILRTRVDTFWRRPPPPLESYDPEAYTIPYGTDCLGYNDRFGMGSRETSDVALSRLTLLKRIRRAGFKNLNSERSFKAQLTVTNTKVARADLPFCVVSRRIYARDMMPVASIASEANLNGAKCRPCEPSYRGEQALLRLKKHYSPQALMKLQDGIDICNTRLPWPEGWEKVFARDAGDFFESQRKAIMAMTDEECVANFDKLKDKSAFWSAPSSLAICKRRRLGPAERLGENALSFDTFVKAVPENGTICVFGKAPNSRWEKSMREVLPRIRYFPESKPPPKISILMTPKEGMKLNRLNWWFKKRKSTICQFLVAFPGKRFPPKERKDFIARLTELGFQLNSCTQAFSDDVYRCTFYFPDECP